MWKGIIAAAILVGVSGCSTARVAQLGGYDAEFAPYASAESVAAVTFRRTGSGGNLARCIASTVSNSGETLGGSSGGFVGAYTGQYYSGRNSTQSTGGGVIEYLDPNGREVVASGSARYQVNALVVRSVRFKLSAIQREGERVYQYAGLQQAQLDAGTAYNDGYAPIGSWAGANPDKALATLSALTDHIEACLAR